MNPITSLFMTTNRWFVLASAVMAFVLGAIWFGPLFARLYIKWMNYPADAKKPDGAMMARQFSAEIVSKVLFYMGMDQAFQAAGRDSLGNGVVLAIVVYVLFVFSTQISLITWSYSNRKALRLLFGKGLIEVVLAAVLWYVVF